MPATKLAPLTFATRIDLPERDRRALIDLLNERLADTADLYSQIKQAHWNVKGTNFFQLHSLFDQLAGEIFPLIDTIAERVTTLGGGRHGDCANGSGRLELAGVSDRGHRRAGPRESTGRPLCRLRRHHSQGHRRGRRTSR